MKWFVDLMTGHSPAQSVIALAVVVVAGMALGRLRVGVVRLGIAGVLFAGLLASHLGLTLEETTLEFVREFGLILFVYTIGVQVGPSFFASFRKEGLRLNLLAMAIVLGGVLVAAAILFITKLPVQVVVGLLAGAVTNTPGLGAAQQALKESMGGVADAGAVAGMAYAMAYPFGIIGIILTMLAVRYALRIKVAEEVEAYDRRTSAGQPAPLNFNFEVANPSLAGRTVRDLAGLVKAQFVVSRLLRGGAVDVPESTTTLQLGDILHIVCSREDAEKLGIVLGGRSTVDVRKVSSEIAARNILITQRSAAGKTIRDLDFMNRYGVAITRLHRAGIELVASANMTLHFGDRVTVVGDEQGMNRVAAEVGNSMKSLNEPNILPVFVGILLGVLLGSVPLAVPGIPAPLKIGLAGGPLLVALCLSQVRKIGPLVWYMPQSANLALREIGITLFLACVGLRSGDRFVETLVGGGGLTWMFLGALITVVPLLVAGFVARLVLKMNYLDLCGLLAGSMTDPPALSFAHEATGSDAPAVTYASVYAFTMFLRILTAQLFVLLLC
jgi:putative transport protein